MLDFASLQSRIVSPTLQTRVGKQLLENIARPYQVAPHR
jgi:hypothetical protein